MAPRVLACGVFFACPGTGSLYGWKSRRNASMPPLIVITRAVVPIGKVVTSEYAFSSYGLTLVPVLDAMGIGASLINAWKQRRTRPLSSFAAESRPQANSAVPPSSCVPMYRLDAPIHQIDSWRRQ